MRYECDDKPVIDEDLDELSLGELTGLLSLVEGCKDCNGCDAMACELRGAISRRNTFIDEDEIG